MKKMEVDGMPKKIMPIIASVGVPIGTSLLSITTVDLPGEGRVFNGSFGTAEIFLLTSLNS